VVGYTDFVRFFVLQLYGGIYIDLDVLLLRDFAPLHGLEYAYRWSKLKEKCNTAVLVSAIVTAVLVSVIVREVQHSSTGECDSNSSTGECDSNSSTGECDSTRGATQQYW
jgi:mannosyltransferase OCH1-like enzyme